jgi:hypothetical protein
LQIRAIAERWPARIERKKNRIRRRRVRKERLLEIRTKRKVRAWKSQITHVGNKAVNMVKEYYADPTSVTLADWNKFIKRNFGKL